ncbi:phosphate transport system regulatory protein PhoU [Kyrpidia spormannii]|uniref:Phosphate-specific transport system accessory protein PhoU n=1 Tax=Kyrpidia spormannii TaxID=2055160 RepID=A0A2K8NBB5_9BACL|nr:MULTISPECIES: phosphate signaling complex protein PhoU [Kyrpidia]ATY86593.1 phosphate transport system regulatory protein PhoU [Kyrpidia spormannii]MCL6575200.1 phosphate signaling complex protein PhoU [Kyrpidia sp.]
MDTRSGFHEELESLEQSLLAMGGLVSQAVRDSVTALKELNQSLAEQVIERDDQLDDMQVEIENRCLRLIALQQPMAGDLRTIGTVLKMVTDLERMGDHAVDIARTALKLSGETLIKPLIDIPRLGEIAQEMLGIGLRAFVDRDADLAQTLADRDDDVDHLYSQIFRELLVLMIEDPSTIRQATQLLFVAQSLERVADHITNIGEWTIYMVTGERRDLNL